MMRKAWLISLFVLLCVTPANGWASDDDQTQNTVSGRIEDIDSLKSMITVRYADPVTGEMEEVDMKVPDETKIMNGSEAITFLDLEQFDSVEATYEGDGSGGFNAKKILQLNQEKQ
jgi:hypothetical protein